MPALKQAVEFSRNEDADTRTLVLDAAARLFSTQGYAAVSLRDIAAAIGIKAGSLYYHFASKDDLLAAVLNKGVQTVHEHVKAAVERLPANASPLKAIETAIIEHLQSVLELHVYSLANIRIISQAPESVRMRVLPHRHAYEAFWMALFEQGKKARLLRAGLDLGLVMRALFSAMNGAIDWYRPDGALSAAEIGGRLANVFLMGIVKQGRK